MPYVLINVDLSEFDDSDLVNECKERGLTVLAPSEESTEAIAERAYLVAREIHGLPCEIKELFWKVHGRAIP